MEIIGSTDLTYHLVFVNRTIDIPWYCGTILVSQTGTDAWEQKEMKDLNIRKNSLGSERYFFSMCMLFLFFITNSIIQPLTN